MTGIRFISRDMRPLESTQEPSLKAGYLNSSLKISDGNLNPKADFLPIHIPGLCLNFGSSQLFLWGWVLLWQFTRQGLIAIIGPSPIETVGNSQNSGISQGCGYDESPPPGFNSRRKFSNFSLGIRPSR